MQPYRFPRSQGSIDLTDHTTLQPSTSSSAPSLNQQPRPSFVITNATPQDGIPRSATEQQHLARMTSATKNLLSQPPTSSQHLSSGYPLQPGGGKTLSRISEYSESAYSADGSSRHNSHGPEPRLSQGLTPSPSTATNESGQGTTPTTMSFSFPAPPSHSSSPPAPTIPLPHPPNPRTTVVSPSPWAYPALPGSPSRSHLPSRPITALTTPIPSSNPNPVPVPISNFANPGGVDRSESPLYLRNNGSQDFARPHGGDDREVMVQLPGRAMVSNPRASYHQSQPSDSTAWTMEGKYSTDKSAYAAYDAVSLAPSTSTNGQGGESNHRFTLDNNEKSPSRLGNIVPVKKGSNRKLLWCLVVLAVIGIAVGTGVGVGMKNLKKDQDANDQVDVGGDLDSTTPSSPSQSVLLPSSSSIVFSSPSPTASNNVAASNKASDDEEPFSTTFGYRIGSETTVVPLTYTIPTSYFTRPDGRIQFTQEVVLPSLSGEGSFTSDLRFRVPPTETIASSAEQTSTSTRMKVKRDSEVEMKEGRKTAFDKHKERKLGPRWVEIR